MLTVIYHYTCIYVSMWQILIYVWFAVEDATKETLNAAETFITLHVKQPEIILVEDSSAKSTNALILDVGPLTDTHCYTVIQELSYPYNFI